MNRKEKHYDILKQVKEKKISINEGMKLLAALKDDTAGNGVSQFYSVTEKEKVLTNDSVGDMQSIWLITDNMDAKKVSNILKNANYRSIICSKPIGETQYDEFVKDLLSKRKLPETICFLCGKEPFTVEEETIQKQLNKVVLPMFYLCKALAVNKVSQKIKLVFACQSVEKVQPVYAALDGFIKTFAAEKPNVDYKIILDCIPKNTDNEITSTIEKVVKEFKNIADKEVVYKAGKRYVKYFAQIEQTEESMKLNLKQNGTYVITGGLGRLGLMLARHFTSQQNINLVLVGRTYHEEDLEELKHTVIKNGSILKFYQADVSKKEDVKQVIAAIQTDFGAINGVVHCAGLLRDSFLFRKTEEDFVDVMAPKVWGTIWLDQYTRDEKLDFFVCYSSGSSEISNIGQADYAYANSFMNYYSELRGNESGGKSVSMIWPYWENGGMQIGEEKLSTIKEKMGVAPLDDKAGMRAFMTMLNNGSHRVLLYQKDKAMDVEQVEAVASVEEGGGYMKMQSVELAKEDKSDKEALYEKTMYFIRDLIAKEMKLNPSSIEEEENFEQYGIDSVAIISLNKVFEGYFGELSKTLFYEYQNLQELAGYFAKNQKLVLRKMFLGDEPNGVSAEVSKPVESKLFENKTTVENTEAIKEVNVEEPEIKVVEYQPGTKKAILEDDIAIIGIDGKYAQSENMDELWKNLLQGKDCITEIPIERWDSDDYYTTDKNETGKSYSKWGGFLQDIDKFDPLFFNTSPREAEIMEPQEKVLLETAWHTLENAGYTRERFEHKRVGVYVGVMYGHFQVYEVELGDDKTMYMPDSYAQIANRISYYFNFNGPSLALDTMCSSSLTTIHFACEALRKGDIDYALAGGVNLNVHPCKYLVLSKQNFLSPTGRCHSFGKDADGYVPGEGCGLVLLKPLSKAVADNDHICAVIKSSSINHGGKVNGFTVPNPKAQISLVKESMKKAGITPDSISYIECHGTGTALGDPIEVTGLTNAFSERQTEGQFCSIGSIKSNIGHCESASGIAAVAKVVLQMEHKMLVPSIHSDILNPNLNFATTPFYVQHSNEEWKGVEITEADGTKRTVRRACVNAFGAGGSNANLIMEAYEPQKNKETQLNQEVQVLPISAKTKERLHVYIDQMIHYLEGIKVQGEMVTLADIAYTLQVGREAMEVRFITFASTIDDYIEKLKQYRESGCGIDMFEGQLGGNSKSEIRKLLDSGEGAEFITMITKNKNYKKLCQLWISGVQFDWKELHGNSTPEIAVIPGYPFKKEHCWMDINLEPTLIRFRRLHPLIDQVEISESLGNGICFKRTLKQNENVIRDHCIKGTRILPGAAFIEMMLFGAIKISQKNSLCLKNVSFIKTLPVEKKKKEIWIEFIQDNSEYHVKISSRYGTNTVVHSQGYFTTGQLNNAAQMVDIQSLKARCQGRIKGKDLYEALAQNGLCYGTYFNIIEEMFVGQNEAIAKIKLDPKFVIESKHYAVFPPIMDAALQTMTGIYENDGKTRVPFSIRQVEYIKSPEEECYAYAVRDGEGKYHIALLDQSGRVCVRLNDVVVKEIPGGGRETTVTADSNEFYFHTKWDVCQEEPNTNILMPVGVHQDKVLIVYTDDAKVLKENLKNAYGNATVYEARLTDTQQKLSDTSWAIDINQETGVQECISQMVQNVDTIYFLSISQSTQSEEAGMEYFERSHKESITSIFRLLKAMVALNVHRKGISLKTVTNNAVKTHKEKTNPYSSAVQGLLLSASKEFAEIDFAYIDIETTILGEMSTAYELINEPCYKPGKMIALRNHTRYERAIYPVSPIAQGTAFRKQGVYVIYGGMGGIGKSLSEYLCHQYQATIILVGRRSYNGEIAHVLENLIRLGGKAEYLQGNLQSLEDMERVYQQIMNTHQQINGVVHSALVLQDKLIQNMSEEVLQKVLEPKVRGAVTLGKVYRNANLDFMLFFSSAEAYGNNMGQGNYGAAGTFEDTYALYLQDVVEFQVRIINWGFWGKVGVASNDDYNQKLGSIGVQSIDVEEGIQVIERFMASGLQQVMYLKAMKETLAYMGVKDLGPLIQQPNPQMMPHRVKKNQTVQQIQQLKVQPENAVEPVQLVTPLAQFKTAPSVGNEDFHTRTVQYVAEKFQKFFKIQTEDLNLDAAFESYGMDSVNSLEITREFEQNLGTLSSTLLYDNTTMNQLVRYFENEHRDGLANMWGMRSKNANVGLFAQNPVSTSTPAPAPGIMPVQNTSLEANNVGIQEFITGYVKNVLCEITRMAEENLDIDASLEQFGIDSVMNLEIIRELEKGFPQIPATLLYDNTTIRQLVDNLMKQYQKEASTLYQNAGGSTQESVYNQSAGLFSVLGDSNTVSGKQEHALGSLIDNMSESDLDEIFASITK